MSIDDLIVRLEETIKPHVPGTILSRCLMDNKLLKEVGIEGNPDQESTLVWSLGIGPLGDPKHFLYARTIEEVLAIAAKLFLQDDPSVIEASATTRVHKVTNKEKRKAVTEALQDEYMAAWSDGEIARQCGVSDHLVANIRKEINPGATKLRWVRRRSGPPILMDMSNIGRRTLQSTNKADGE